MDAQRLELKAFLMDNLYRHYRVMRMAEKAKRVMTELFEAYMSEPQAAAAARPRARNATASRCRA